MKLYKRRMICTGTSNGHVEAALASYSTSERWNTIFVFITKTSTPRWKN